MLESRFAGRPQAIFGGDGDRHLQVFANFAMSTVTLETALRLLSRLKVGHSSAVAKMEKAQSIAMEIVFNLIFRLPVLSNIALSIRPFSFWRHPER
jgi:hypothetical protein